MGHALDDDDQWFDTIPDIHDDPTTWMFDEFFSNRANHIVNSFTLAKSLKDQITNTKTISYQVQAQAIKSRELDYEALSPYFGWLSSEIVKKMFKCTTQ